MGEAAATDTKNIGNVGKRLYPPLLLAAYTILLNIALGLILYGLNLRNRGYRLYGRIVIGSGILPLFIDMHSTAQWLPMTVYLPVSITGGITIYKNESSPYQKAIAEGATKAKWWPPVAITTAIWAAIFLYGLYKD